MIKLGVHRWSFSVCSTKEAALIARSLGFKYMDLGNARDINIIDIEKDIAAESDKFIKIKQETGIKFYDAVPHVDPPFANNHPDPEKRKVYRKQLKAFFEFASKIGLDGITLSPGKYWPQESPIDSFNRAAEEIDWAVQIGKKHNLHIRIEPHVQSITWTPALAVKMVQTVNDLSITVDYSHFIFNSLSYEQISVLNEYGTHFHARQAKPGLLQCKYEKGEIDFPRLINDLKDQKYNGIICLEYNYSPWLGMDNIDCLRETVLLRNRLNNLINR